MTCPRCRAEHATTERKEGFDILTIYVCRGVERLAAIRRAD